MKPVLLRHALALAVVIGTASGAAADEIRITSGGLDWSRFDGTIRVTLAGEGLSFDGATSVTGGIFAPWNQCTVPECTGGTTVDLLARFLGNDMGGTATYGGTTYLTGGLSPEAAQMFVEFTGSLTIPALFAGGVLTAPFQFIGEFAYPEGPAFELTRVGLFGHGNASLTFSAWDAFPGAFVLDAARYEFDQSAPVPEPASMLLIGTGLAGLAAARRRRRAAGRRPADA